jgi:hypothetical protein
MRRRDERWKFRLSNSRALRGRAERDLLEQSAAFLSPMLDRLLEASLLSRQASHLMRATCSSTPWCRTRPRACSCASRGAPFARISEAALDSPDSFPGPLVPEAMKHLGRRKPHVAAALDGSPSPPIQPRAIVPGNPLNEAEERSETAREYQLLMLHDEG